ncbi:DUF1801 domain-containing protein [Joostella atrarenae]|uniref:DUF1801 domain-containing protein n=1 Tax=Joostella atrarenae TaxID=679257 RepID=A0ABS9J6G0_9FLAO|nr:DUF1801 domain-containing protein [Joostella atrarenae]MCF8715965.1 DUF1801 domain-containing protein [Joostella atrarenae]
MNPAEVYILNQKEPYRSMLLELQILVTATLPNLELKYKYKIPFFYLNGKPFCYFNVTKGYVDVCFWKGFEITKFKELLVTENRKMIKSLRYYTPEAINSEVLIPILKELETLY